MINPITLMRYQEKAKDYISTLNHWNDNTQRVVHDFILYPTPDKIRPEINSEVVLLELYVGEEFFYQFHVFRGGTFRKVEIESDEEKTIMNNKFNSSAGHKIVDINDQVDLTTRFFFNLLLGMVDGSRSMPPEEGAKLISEIRNHYEVHLK